MNTKKDIALKLISQKDDAKMFQGICLILEIYEENPDHLDPLTRALVEPLLKRLVKSTEKSLGVKAF